MRCRRQSHTSLEIRYGSKKKQNKNKLDWLDLKSQMSTHLRTHLIFAVTNTLLKPCKRTTTKDLLFLLLLSLIRLKFFGPMGGVRRIIRSSFYIQEQLQLFYKQSCKISMLASFRRTRKCPKFYLHWFNSTSVSEQ